MGFGLLCRDLFHGLGAIRVADNRHHTDGMGPPVVHQVDCRLFFSGELFVEVLVTFILPPGSIRDLLFEPTLESEQVLLIYRNFDRIYSCQGTYTLILGMVVVNGGDLLTSLDLSLAAPEHQLTKACAG